MSQENSMGGITAAIGETDHRLGDKTSSSINPHVNTLGETYAGQPAVTAKIIKDNPLPFVDGSSSAAMVGQDERASWVFGHHDPEENPMQQYLDNLKLIHTDGFDHSDRTGHGRRSIFGVTMRFDLTKGFPLDGSRQIFHEAIGPELLFFIAGDTDKSVLEAQGVKIWNKWTPDEKHIDAFLTRFKMHLNETQIGKEAEVDSDEEAALRAAYKENYKAMIGSIGPMYGAMWRNAPGDGTPTLALREADVQGRMLNFLEEQWAKVPSDKKTRLANMLVYMHAKIEEFKDDPMRIFQDTEPGNNSARKFRFEALHEYWKTIDQLALLIENLKLRPHSSRHRVTAMVPEFYPFEEYNPQENVLAGRGALTPCHCIFQLFVSPPKEEGGKNRLSLQMYQSSCDFPVGVPYNIAQYAMLLEMIAQVVDMEAREFIWVGGDVHYYMNVKHLVEEHLTRQQQPLPKLWLNPEVKDLFGFKPEDIKIIDYKPLAPIKYPVAV